MSGAIASIVIGSARVLIFGVNISSLTALVVLLVLTVISFYISKKNITTFRKFIYINGSNIVIVFLALFFLVKDPHKLSIVLTYYRAIAILGGFIIYYISDYVVRSNENFRILKDSAERDFLTGLNNVRQFDSIWNTHVTNAKERKERLSILLIDIDHFKNINDTYGHPVGDLVLKELGNVLKQTTRSFDTVSRNGGEEFSVILPDCPNKQAVEIAERIRIAVAKHEFEISSTEKINITVSIGEC
ncbi:GGDEF domain-containing protein [Bacillus pinisoli]|uniref:GGDEF domain-containing protein n=1 Tax=Bacillus pinisoli TaxID=2901866 RepID=UPI001FF12180|nr:GGDEF domain-containing protein [Bacillus pinisoli]